MNYRVPFIKPSFPSGSEISSDYEKIVLSNWFTNFGPFEKSFRNDISEYIGPGTSVCTAANATLALDVAILALFRKNDIKKRVITQSFTFAAASERLIANGYTPVFVDIDDNMQPDVEQARQFLSRNHSTVSGILICNTFGVGNPRIREWEQLGKEYELPLIIDSAAGLGSEYSKGCRVGLRGDCEIFSFHATKPFSVGEGGAVTSKSAELIEAMRSLTNFGFGQDREVKHIGTNAKLQELSCAIGSKQMLSFPERISQRRQALEVYKKALTSIGYSFQENDGLSSVPFVSILAENNQDAETTRKSLIAGGVEARDYYRPLHKQGYLVRFCEVAHTLNRTEDVASRIISAPMHDDMSKNDIQFVLNFFK